MNKKFERVAQYAIPVLGLIVIGGGVALAAPQDENGNKFLNRPVLTEEQREIRKQAKELREAGDHEGAHELLEANDLHIRKGFKVHKGGERAVAIRAAVESGDYVAFIEATEGTPFGERLDAQSFPIFVEAQELRKEGNHEEARSLMESIGFEKRGEHRGKKGENHE